MQLTSFVLLLSSLSPLFVTAAPAFKGYPNGAPALLLPRELGPAPTSTGTGPPIPTGTQPCPTGGAPQYSAQPTTYYKPRGPAPVVVVRNLAQPYGVPVVPTQSPEPWFIS